MSNIIIVIILVVIMAFGIKETVKHFRGEGGCCGGTYSKVKKKKLKNEIVQRYVLKIDGMSCKHCVNTITEIINDFDGAAGRVSLNKGQAEVLCERVINIEEVEEKIRSRGYDVTRI